MVYDTDRVPIFVDAPNEEKCGKKKRNIAIPKISTLTIIPPGQIKKVLIDQNLTWVCARTIHEILCQFFAGDVVRLVGL